MRFKKKIMSVLMLIIMTFNLASCAMVEDFLNNLVVGGTSSSSSLISVPSSSISSSSSSSSFSSSSKVHEHKFSDQWSFDTDYHYHASVCGHNVKKDYELHTYDEWVDVGNGRVSANCIVCGVTTVKYSEHQHTYSDAWSYDKDYHFHEAKCCFGNKIDIQEHDFSSWQATSNGRYRECIVCKYIEEVEDNHEHKFSNLWSYDYEMHYREAKCCPELRKDEEYHNFSEWEYTYSNLKVRSCVVCRYKQEIKEDHEHVNEKGKCTLCGEPYFSEGLTYELISSYYKVTGIGTCTDENIVIPDMIDGYKVSTIGTGAFSSETKIKSIIVPKYVTSIEDNAINVASLDYLYLPKGLKNVSAYQTTFQYTPVFLNGEKSDYSFGWDQKNFYYGVTLDEVFVNQNGTYVYDNRVLTIANGNKNLSKLEESMFYYDSIPVQAIGAYAFYGSKLTEIYLPNGVEKIGYNAFALNDKLRILGIPSSVKEIEDYAIFSYTNDIYIACEAKSKPVGWGNSWALDRTYVAWDSKTSDLVICDDYAYSNGNVKTLLKYNIGETINLNSPFALPNGVVLDDFVISDNALRYNTTVKHVILPYGMENIPTSFFGDARSLESVQIPITVKTISSGAFSSYYSFKTIYYEGTINDWPLVEGTQGLPYGTEIIVDCNINHVHEYIVNFELTYTAPSTRACITCKTCHYKENIYTNFEVVEHVEPTKDKEGYNKLYTYITFEGQYYDGYLYEPIAKLSN